MFELVQMPHPNTTPWPQRGHGHYGWPNQGQVKEGLPEPDWPKTTLAELRLGWSRPWLGQGEFLAMWKPLDFVFNTIRCPIFLEHEFHTPFCTHLFNTWFIYVIINSMTLVLAFHNTFLHGTWLIFTSYLIYVKWK